MRPWIVARPHVHVIGMSQRFVDNHFGPKNALFGKDAFGQCEAFYPWGKEY